MTINFAPFESSLNELLSRVQAQDVFGSCTIDAGDQRTFATEAEAVLKELSKLHGDITKAEGSLKRRKHPNANAAQRVLDLKGVIGNLIKVFGSMKGSKTEWSSVCDAWKKLEGDAKVGINACKGIVGWGVKREVLEIIKFGRMDHLKPIFSGGHGIFDLVNTTPKVRRAIMPTGSTKL